MTPAISPENSWLNAIVSVKDSRTRSSRGCKHGQPPASRGLLRRRAVKPLPGADGRWRTLFPSFSPPVSSKNCFLYPNKESTHTHNSNKLGGLITSLLSAFASLALARSLSLIIDNFSFGFGSPALILKQLGCQLFSWKPGTRRWHLGSPKLNMYGAPATLPRRWQWHLVVNAIFAFYWVVLPRSENIHVVKPGV